MVINRFFAGSTGFLVGGATQHGFSRGRGRGPCQVLTPRSPPRERRRPASRSTPYGHGAGQPPLAVVAVGAPRVEFAKIDLRRSQEPGRGGDSPPADANRSSRSDFAVSQGARP